MVFALIKRTAIVGAFATKWKTDNENVITVGKGGDILACRSGTANIYAYTDIGRKYKIKIEVSDAPGMLDNRCLISHRGYTDEAPENTISAFERAYEYGYRYVETDVNFTSDGVPVLLHDETIDRTSNGTGRINSLSYDYVRNFDFGSWKGMAYKGERIPSFDEFIEFCSKHGIHPFVELKANITQDRAYQLLEIVNKYDMKNNVSWISFNLDYLLCIKSADSCANLGLNTYSIDDNTYKSIQKLKTINNKPFLCTATWCMNEDVIRQCKKENIPICVGMCETKEEIKLLDSYISLVTSDSLKLSE